MKLKDLVNKEFKVIFSGNMVLFTEEDVEKVGENYEVSKEEIEDKMKSVLYDEEVNVVAEFKTSIKLIDDK